MRLGFFFKTKVSFVVGGERRVKFWKDWWCSKESVCDILPSLFTLFDLKEVWVVDFCEQSGRDKFETSIWLGI